MKNIRKGNNDEVQYSHFFDSHMPIFHITAGMTFPNTNYEVQRVDPPCYIFEYIIKGRCAVQVNDNIFTAEADDVIIFPPSTFQHFYSDKNAPIQKIWIIYDCDLFFINSLIKSYKLENTLLVKNVKNTIIPHLFDDIVQMVKTKPSDFARNLEIETLRLIGAISDNVTFTDKANSIAELGKMHIDRMLNAHFTIDYICKIIGTSRSLFFKNFKKEYGVSPAVYIINKKIELSKKILEDDTTSITDIAASFDFSSTAHFSSTFKKIVGVTPLEYRKKHQNK